jgi:L,D-transpeptidase ErfK/SrfK
MTRRSVFPTILASLLLASALIHSIQARANELVASALSGDIIGELRPFVTAYDDTLLDIARDNGLGYVEIIAANPGVDPWVPGEQTKILLSTAHILPDAERSGIVVNRAEHRLYYFPSPGAAPITLPVGIGKDGWETPLGRTEIVRKKEGPIWYPTVSIREEQPDLPTAVPPGPDNPLGSHALYFGWPTYLIHGTNEPWGIGRRVTHGCVRLYPEDISRLFDVIALGTPVQLIDQAVKIGWMQGDLYVEAHPDTRQSDELEATGRMVSAAERPLADVFYRIRTEAGANVDRLDWQRIRTVLRERSGVPVRVTREVRVAAD